MIEWLKDKILGLSAKILLAWAPDLIAKLLASIEPADVAGYMKPALRSVLAKLSPEWRPVFARTLRLLAQIASEVATEAESGGGS
ncbi:MAG: hypothetical protein RBS17_01555 [Coriobacteriia bacterium]|jgi:hypothetical protein|nr:hypothetical protein [Coriobacteriia bacterium]